MQDTPPFDEVYLNIPLSKVLKLKQPCVKTDTVLGSMSLPHFIQSYIQRGLAVSYQTLLRAGAYGAWYGGNEGKPEIGIMVRPTTPAEFVQTTTALQELKLKATLTIEGDLALAEPDLLFEAASAGHELAGSGQPKHLLLLEAAARQPIKSWASSGLSRRDLSKLARWEVHLLPLPLSKAEPGHIIQIAPTELKERLQELKQLGYQPVPVKALPELRQATLRDLFFHWYVQLIEERFARQSNMIDLSQRADAFMRVVALDHAPAPLPFDFKTPTAEIHVHSRRVVGQASNNQLKTYRAHRRSMQDVARALETHPDLQEARVIFAVTLLFSPLEAAGFHIIELPPLRARFYGFGFRLLRLAYGTTSAPSEGIPRMGWMAREEFLEKYGSGPAHSV